MLSVAGFPALQRAPRPQSLKDFGEYPPEQFFSGVVSCAGSGVQRRRCLGARTGARRSRAKSGPGGVGIGDVERGKWYAQTCVEFLAGAERRGVRQSALALVLFAATGGRLFFGP